MIEATPTLSFGVPVRNSADSVVRCLESVAGQDFEDIEIIVSDNDSTDETQAVVRDFATKDSRVRLVAQPENIGLIDNFNAVARLARGKYFRWVGADDWIEKDCASSTVEALDATPDALVATSYFDLAVGENERLHEEFVGEYVDSADPVKRFRRMLGFFEEGPTRYEPIYSTMRRQALLDVGILRIHRNTDWLLSSQLSLAGPFVHVPKTLLHRSWPRQSDEKLLDLPKRLHPERYAELTLSSRRLLKGFSDVLDDADLTRAQTLRCRWHAQAFCARYAWQDLVRSARRFRRNRLGLTREAFGRKS